MQGEGNIRIFNEEKNNQITKQKEYDIPATFMASSLKLI